MATIIKISGKRESIQPKDGNTFSLKELQAVVSGYIELLPIKSGDYAGKILICDEEGKLKPDAQLNTEASKIAGQRIVGDVIVIDRDQIK